MFFYHVMFFCCFVTSARDSACRNSPELVLGGGAGQGRAHSLLAAPIQVLDHPGKADVQQPDLTIQVVHLLLQAAVAVPPPVKAHGARHEVDGHHKAQGQHGVLGVALVFLQDVDAGQGEQGHSGDPEEAAEEHVQEVKEESQEER